MAEGEERGQIKGRRKGRREGERTEKRKEGEEERRGSWEGNPHHLPRWPDQASVSVLDLLAKTCDPSAVMSALACSLVFSPQ